VAKSVEKNDSITLSFNERSSKHVHIARSREISITGEGDSTTCAIVNQLCARLLNKFEKNFFEVTANFLWIDDCISSTSPSPLYKDFPASSMSQLVQTHICIRN
jgi:hypothetical protein